MNYSEIWTPWALRERILMPESVNYRSVDDLNSRLSKSAEANAMMKANLDQINASNEQLTKDNVELVNRLKAVKIEYNKRLADISIRITERNERENFWLKRESELLKGNKEIKAWWKKHVAKMEAELPLHCKNYAADMLRINEKLKEDLAKVQLENRALKDKMKEFDSFVMMSANDA
ncbi:hypothetical protein HK098_007139 [Nowakowskiella sp. JEL0407]|nr:hypothetical protein HK098_007139 [Nowakowskiella sp. JEL0407]